MTHWAFPYAIDERGRTAGASRERHVRDLIEQLLLTSPGERVNRPDFGSGLLDAVFAPGGDAVAAATQGTVQAALNRWLGDILQVDAVQVQAQESTLEVVVRYRLRSDGEPRVERFTREVTS